VPVASNSAAPPIRTDVVNRVVRIALAPSFTTHDIAESGHDVFAKVARSNRIAANEPQGFDDSLVGDCFCGHDNH
jgi:hypothetical protein